MSLKFFRVVEIAEGDFDEAQRNSAKPSSTRTLGHGEIVLFINTYADVNRRVINYVF